MFEEQQESLETLKDIRSMMERSSRFLSLSGLSGVFAGIYALAGAIAAWLFIDRYHYGRLSENVLHTRYYQHAINEWGELNFSFLNFFLWVAFSVLVLSVVTGLYFSWKKSRKKGLPFWDRSAMRMALNLFIPLGAGGLFCLALLYQKQVAFLAPATLIFYGLALLNASKYTLNDIRYLGMSEIVLGLVASFSLGYGLLFWAIGFGVLHIIYGSVMYFKYER